MSLFVLGFVLGVFATAGLLVIALIVIARDAHYPPPLDRERARLARLVAEDARRAAESLS